MEHNHGGLMRFGRSFSFLNGWFVGSMLISQGVLGQCIWDCDPSRLRIYKEICPDFVLPSWEPADKKGTFEVTMIFPTSPFGGTDMRYVIIPWRVIEHLLDFAYAWTLNLPGSFNWTLLCVFFLQQHGFLFGAPRTVASDFGTREMRR